MNGEPSNEQKCLLAFGERLAKLENDGQSQNALHDLSKLDARLTALESQLPSLHAWRTALDGMQRALVDWQAKLQNFVSLSLQSAARAPRKRASGKKSSARKSGRKNNRNATAKKRAVKRRSRRAK